VGEKKKFAGEGRMREIKLPGAMGKGTTMCSREGL